MHFAALAYVGESVADPLAYYDNNTGGAVSLLLAMKAAGVRRMVFSSTCATYGEPETTPIVETMPQSPINPYGWSKWCVERVLRDYAAAERDFSFVALRYFNVAGCAADGSLGEDHAPETHLIPLLLLAALKQRDALTVFGSDYPTPDGTCIRDYVHVEDLCAAPHFGDGGPSARRRAILQPRHRQGIFRARGDRGGPAGDGPRYPDRRRPPPARRSGGPLRQRREDSPRTRLVARLHGNRRDCRHGLEVVPRTSARIRCVFGPLSLRKRVRVRAARPGWSMRRADVLARFECLTRESMMFTIKSSRSDTELAFIDFEGDYYNVELRGSEVSAFRHVWGYTDCELLVDLLRHLAKQERGWQEPAEWTSIESDLAMKFRSDSRGHVFVDVEMRRCRGEEDWTVMAEIQTELGQMPKIASGAASFFQCD